MKAFLLAAGAGTRLKTLTEETPKCLLPIRGKPLLRYWLDTFEKYHVRYVFINTSSFTMPVMTYVYQVKPRIRITLSFEEKLLGSAGTLFRNRGFTKGEKDFLILYADNFTNLNLYRIVTFHRRRRALATIGLFKTDKPEECGIVQMNEDNVILNIEEKPKNPKGNLAFAGIMVMSQSAFDYMNFDMFDIAKDLLPRLIETGKLYGFTIQETLIDIGTPDGYKKANEGVLKCI